MPSPAYLGMIGDGIRIAVGRAPSLCIVFAGRGLPVRRVLTTPVSSVSRGHDMQQEDKSCTGQAWSLPWWLEPVGRHGKSLRDPCGTSKPIQANRRQGQLVRPASTHGR